MAVYTEVTDEALREFLAEYELGELLAYRGIAEGVETSNYALKTAAGCTPSNWALLRSTSASIRGVLVL